MSNCSEIYNKLLKMFPEKGFYGCTDKMSQDKMPQGPKRPKEKTSQGTKRPTLITK